MIRGGNRVDSAINELGQMRIEPKKSLKLNSTYLLNMYGFETQTCPV